MARQQILVTGSNGKIGRTVIPRLEEAGYAVHSFDLPNYNATDYAQLQRQLQGCFGLVHLAFDLKNENSRAGKQGNPDNRVMGINALAAAAKLGVRKCVIASSVNAARTARENNWAYRTTKLALEAEADLFAEAYPETDFTSIRFGRVTIDDSKPELPLRPDQTWISHRDAGALVLACLEAESHDGEHHIVYGVSNRPDMPYPIENPFGWAPQDSFGS